MFQLLYNYFYDIFSNRVYGNVVNQFLNESTVNCFDLTFSFGQYFALFCSLISIVFILICCILFIYRIIRLIARLFSGGTL